MSPFDLIFNLARNIGKSGKSAVTSLFNTDVGKITGNTQFNNTIPGIAANTVLGLPKAALTTAKDIGQTILRTGIGLGGDVRNAVVPTAKQNFEYQPTGVMATILGKEPVKTLAMRAAEGEQAIKASPFAQKIGADKAALPLAFGGTIASSFLDLYPGTAGKGKILSKLANETSDIVVKNILKKEFTKLSESTIGTLATKIAKTKDVNEVTKLLEVAHKNLTVPKLAPEIKDNIVRIIDDHRLNGTKDLVLQQDAARIAEDLNLPKTKRYGDLVTNLEDVLARQPVDPRNITKEAILAAERKTAGQPVIKQGRDVIGRYDVKPKYATAEQAINSPESKAFYDKINAQKKALKVTPKSNNLYHTTSIDNLDSIAKNGLTSGNPARFEGVSGKGNISFSANEAGASYYGGKNDVMIRTKAGYKPTDLTPDLLAGGDGTYISKTNIPPAMLEVKINGKWQSLTDYTKSKTTPSNTTAPISNTPSRIIDNSIPQNFNTAEEYVKAQEAKSTIAGEYVGSHQAPIRDGYNAPSYDLTGEGNIYPSDIYTNPKAYQIYGERGTPEHIAQSKKSLDIALSLKGKPNAEVTIYRSVSKNIKDIKAGDWVTLNRDYAVNHGESNLKGKYNILEKKVKASEIFTDGNSVNEFGYDPNPLTKSQLTDIWTKANGKKPSVLDTIKRKLGGDLPNKQGGFAANPFFRKPINEADRLIAEGKIRVKSENGRDVYEYKKGNIWQRARDEDSAVKGASPKPVEQLPEVLQQRQTQLEIQKEALASTASDVNPLMKYVSPATGRLPEVTGKDTIKSLTGSGKDISNSKFGKSGDDIVTEHGFATTNEAQTAIDKFLANKKSIAEQEAQLRADIKEAKIAKLGEKKPIKYSDEGIPMAYTKPSEASKVVAQPFAGSQGEAKSLEKLAKQAQSIMEGVDVPRDVSLPKIISETITPVQKKVHIIDTYLRTPDRVMQKIGFGKEAKDLRKAADNYWKELPKNVAKIDAWRKEVSAESNIRIFKFLDGEAITLTTLENKVAGEIRTWLSQWGDRLHLAKDRRISDYITHLFDDKSEFDENLAKLISDRIPGSVYNPFLLERLGAKGYKQDTWLALSAYVKRATRKVWMDPVLADIQLGTGATLDTTMLEKSQFKYIQKYIDNINMRPSDLDASIDNMVKSVVGYKFGNRPITYITKLLRQFTFRGALGLNLSSSLRNLSQGVNTYAILGEKYTTIGYASLFKKGAFQELRDNGILNAGFIQDKTLSATGKAIENADKALFFFFDTAEKINRGSAYFGAKSKGLAQGMTETQAIDYASEIVRKTQFKFDTVDTPVGQQGDIMKTLFQFQSYTTKQIEFLTELGKNKNYAGLLRYAVGGLLFTYTVGQAFGMDWKELLPMYRFDTPASLKFPVAAGGALLNTPDKFGNQRSIGQKASDIGQSAVTLAPAGSQIKKTTQGIQSVQQGGSYTSNGKLQFTQEQSMASQVQSVLFGKYASQNAQDYFAGETANVKAQNAIRPTYNKVQELLASGDQQGALDLANSLSDTDKVTYKAIKTTEKAKATLQGKKDILPIYENVQAKLKAGDQEGALAIANALTPEEQKYYKLVKADKAKITASQNGTKPSFNPDEVVSTNSVIDNVWNYAKAIGVDPVTAFNRIFTGQKIKYVANGTIVVERMPLSASQAESKAQGGGANMRLDHTVPLELSGDNSKGNLKLVPEAVWASYTPVENALGTALRAGKINKSKAQELIKKFKAGEVTADEIYSIIQGK